MIGNALRAAKLDVDFYNLVERDTSYKGQAFAVVVIVSVLSGIGNAIAFSFVNLFEGITAAVIAGVLGWVIWAALAAFVGTKVFGGTSDTGEMLRVLGFAQAPRAIGVVPFLGWIGGIWALVASVVAIREGLDFSTGKAIGTVVVGWLAWLVIAAVLNVVLGAWF